MMTRLQPPIPLNLPKTSVQPPSHISASTNDAGLLFRQKILHLQALNVNPQKALHQNPNFRCTPLSSLLSLEHYLLSLGLSRPAVGRILDMHPKLLTADIPRDLEPIIDFLLEEVLIPFNDLPKSLTRCPRILVSDLKTQLRPSFKFLVEFGFKGSHKINCQTTVLLVSSVERTLKPKIDFLKNLGLSDEEVERMVIRSPGLLTFSVENNLVPKVDFFIQEMKGDLDELKKFPQYFSFSLERKIKPRYRILVDHGFKLPLAQMLRVSDGEFNARLIEMRLKLAERSSL
ncbi:transcription termination factor MTEF1 [Citrus sinensis]|nr:transcription termination factor MTEF1 [Citrus sinensis]